MNTHDPKWLQFLSRRMAWLAVPNIAIIFVTLQALGFLLLATQPAAYSYLPLIPERVLQGEFWRLITFLSIPVTTSPIFLFFALWFSYSVINWIESEWGAFKTTFYMLVSIVLTVIFSFAFDYPVAQAVDFSSTLFLAAAALFPNVEINLYMVIPVKMKWLGYISLAFVVYRLFGGFWIDRLFILTIYSNYLIFFGPSLWFQIRDWKRRRDYQRKWRN